MQESDMSKDNMESNIITGFYIPFSLSYTQYICGPNAVAKVWEFHKYQNKL